MLADRDIVRWLRTPAPWRHNEEPRMGVDLAELVRIMNTYYSNLIEGHDTRPRDIERALAGQFDGDEGRRHLQVEAHAPLVGTSQQVSHRARPAHRSASSG